MWLGRGPQGSQMLRHCAPLWIASRNWWTPKLSGWGHPSHPVGAIWPHLDGSIHSGSTLRATHSPPLNCWSPSSLLQGTHSLGHMGPPSTIPSSIVSELPTLHQPHYQTSISTSWWFNCWICKGITPSSWCMMRAIDWHSIQAGPKLQPDQPSSLNHTHSWWMGQPLAPWLVLVFTTEWLVAFKLGLVITWLGTWLVTTGHPADVAISMAAVSSGLKELTGVSGRVWSESVHLINMIFWCCMHLLTIMGSNDLRNQYYHCMWGGWNFIDDRNPLHVNTLKNNYTYNKLQLV